MLLHKSAGIPRAMFSSSVISRRFKHVLPGLPYDYGALEPVISAEMTRLHHQKHHATYVNNLNVAEEKCREPLQKGDVRAAIPLQGALKFNGVVHSNRSKFSVRSLWTSGTKQDCEKGTKHSQKQNMDSVEEPLLKRLRSVDHQLITEKGLDTPITITLKEFLDLKFDIIETEFRSVGKQLDGHIGGMNFRINILTAVMFFSIGKYLYDTFVDTKGLKEEGENSASKLAKTPIQQATESELKENNPETPQSCQDPK